jgi:soluble lytic murein transglycosylase-like protein
MNRFDSDPESDYEESNDQPSENLTGANAPSVNPRLSKPASENPSTKASAKASKRPRTDKSKPAAKDDKSGKKKSKPEKPKETPLFQLDRGKWKGGTLSERIQRVRWIGIALWRTAPFWLIGAIIIALFGPNIVRMMAPAVPAPLIAPFFTREVQYWGANLRKWGAQYGVDPNLIATLMQIESCGLQSANSSAGAQGLFQVMPFHFDDGEDMTDPETNARRGVGVIRECLGYANGDPGLAMACYNGGPSLVYRDMVNWPQESQNYYRWGTGIYGDASAGRTRSAALDNWLDSGGVYLCEKASVVLGLPTIAPNQITPRPTQQPNPPTVMVSDPNQAFIGAPVQDAAPGSIPPTLSLNDPGSLPTFAIETPTPSNTPPQP